MNFLDRYRGVVTRAVIHLSFESRHHSRISSLGLPDLDPDLSQIYTNNGEDQILSGELSPKDGITKGPTRIILGSRRYFIIIRHFS